MTTTWMPDNLESTPEWLEYFEKKKQPPLGHEFGSGAPCTQCDLCPGLQLHFWRKKCQNCSCPLDVHLVDDEHFPQYTFLFGDGRVKKMIADFKGRPTQFDWVPDAAQDRVNEYMLLLPEELRPIAGSAGGLHRKQQLARQLPFYDILGEHVNESDAKAFHNYLTSLQKHAAGRGSLHRLNELVGDDIFHASPVWFHDPSSSESVDHRPQRAELLPAGRRSDELSCHQCRQQVKGEELVVRASKLGNAIWHPGCFQCSTCEELLVDLYYFQHADSVYCGRDYATAVKLLRCFACDELIFEKEYTSANGKFYHIKHFCCSACDESLAGRQFAHKGEDIMCPVCYEKHNQKICDVCKLPISVFEERLEIGKLLYHKAESCFKCKVCRKSLQGLAVIFNHGYLYCSKDCFQESQ